MVIRSLKKILGDNRGTGLIELAIAAPVLLILVLGISDLGRVLSQGHMLRQAVNRSLELAQGSTREIDYSFLADEAAAAARVPREQVVFEQWLLCNSTRKVWTDDCNGGESARYVKLTVFSYFQPFFGTMWYANAQPDGTVKLTAHGSLRVR